MTGKSLNGFIVGLFMSFVKVPDYVSSYGTVYSYKTEFHPLVLLAWIAGGIIGSVWFFAASDALYYLERTANASEDTRNMLAEKTEQKEITMSRPTQYGTGAVSDNSSR